MKNLIKNAIRSFKNNKISLIGLIFLLFFGLGTFCVMSNTTANINNQYTSIAKEGHLHEFTASELYEIGNAAYKCHSKGFEYTVPAGTYVKQTDINKLSTELYSISTRPIESGSYFYAVPTQTRVEDGDNYIYTRTYNLELDEKASTGLYAKFAATKAPQTKFEVKVVEKIAKTASTPTYITATNNLQGDVSTWTNENMAAYVAGETLLRDAGNALVHDFNHFLKGISDQTQVIYNMMTTKDTLLSKYIDTNYKDEVDYRFFKSINVTASKDNIFYKVIKSNPSDTIDQIVLFKDPNNNYGNTLFSSSDWAPFGSDLVFYDKNGEIIPAGTKFGDDFTIPSSFEDLVTIKVFPRDTIQKWDDEKKYVYSQILHIRFKRMWAGDRSTANETVEDLLKSLSAITYDTEQYCTELFFAGQSTLAKDYDSYVDYSQNYWNENIIVSLNGNIVVNWSVPTPLTCTMVNWTSHFSVINPQHLKAVNKHVIDAKWFNNFEPYKEWYHAQHGYYPTGGIDQRTVINWFNSLTNRQFNFWWNPRNDTSINQMEYEIIQPDGSIKKVIVIKGQQSGQWNGIPDESIASCGEYNQIIWGCGLSPDFMYPVVDITRPTPNPKTECLTYCNDAGYKALKLAFFNSPTEDFLVAKFMPSVTTTRQNEIINDLNKFCAANMLFPKEIKAVYRSNDTNNVLNSSAFRISYIPTLVNVIQIISIILCTFLGIIALVICLIIIKRYVENNRVNIGIMRANGIGKMKIALSLFPFALFPAIIGGIAAYLTGLFLQIPMLGLFKNYWTLPTPILSFDWVSMVTCIFLPFLLFFAMTIIATLWVLHTKSVDLMKAGSEFKTNGFSKIAKKPFKHFNVLVRFRVALAFNSLSRLIMLAIMSCLTMTSLVFAMTTFGRLRQSQAINSSQFDYSFSLQLTTPTTVGGTYAVEDWSARRDDGTLKGLGYTNEDQYIYNVTWNTQGDKTQRNLTKWYSDALILSESYKEALGNNGNLFFPTMADALGQKEDLQYLMNKTCSKLTLDYVVGLGSLSSNPWEIAIALMPANSRNMASSGYNKIVEKIGTAIDDTKHPKHAKWEPYREFFAGGEEGGELTKPYEMSVTTKSWLSHFSADYAKFLVQIYTDEELMADEYRITYGIVPTNWTYGIETKKKDELYSYLTGKFLSLSSKQRSTFDPTHEITIEGIAKDSQYINLTDANGQNLNALLYSVDAEEDTLPVVINAYAAHKYNLGVKSTFSIVASNTADRFDRQINPEYDKQDKSNQAKFRVVGISQGTNGEAFYCRQYDANNILGLPNGESWNKTHKYMLWQEGIGYEKRVIDLSGINASDKYHYPVYHVDPVTGKLVKEDTEVLKFNTVVPVGFNGIYTADKSGRPLTNGLSLYSYSGLYPGSSVFNADAMEQLLANGNNLAVANFITGINDEKTYAAYAKGGDLTAAIKEFIGLLRKYYGDTTMVTCICGAMDVAASDLIYNNLISTFNLAETTIMSVIIPITIIVVGIISNLIINDSRKMAAMLKALGYSDKKNAMSILALFVPTIIIGLALAIPATMGIAIGYQSLIFSTANILVDVTRQWWYYLAAVGGIGVILLATYAVGLVSLKRDRLVDAIKR